MSTKTILVVDDNNELRENICEALESENYTCLSAASGEEAIDIARNHAFEAALVDLVLPGINGIELIGQLRQQRPHARIIMITAYATVENAVEAMKQGASDYLIKPFNTSDLVMTLQVNSGDDEDSCCDNIDEDALFYTLSNEIRRSIIDLLGKNSTMKFMDITRALGIEDHTKMYFHLKVLRKAQFIEQTESEYALTQAGRSVLGCLYTIHRNFMQ
ncbi:response regulator [Desulfurispirillum indicum]|uniref:Response regulator receiver n=1 Tax=Desulfurispirillum indicum (strain ATCC BAA-1389 / DSM 22839 / S5) TaxID=653733 RepID=E6W4P5_DESIS|nr:helix-turn-helix domain-containing protein [Desulfurispirillum indicum]ADU67118.1 response regulator receiver [Desulfurispirillum indicum S5]UCZ56442.1 response regulator [Desulfurispirillum indicum]